MLTIGLPGFLAFVFYHVIFQILWKLVGARIMNRNPDGALGRAMMFVA